MKTKVCVLFGGESSEYEISLRSAYSIIQNLDKEIYEIILVGITKDGKWYLFDKNIDDIPTDNWYDDTLLSVGVNHAEKKSELIILSTNKRIPFDVCFPVLHGKNGEDGTIQGLFDLAGIKYVGMNLIGSALGMDKTFAKLVFQNEGINQAKWVTMKKYQLTDIDHYINEMEEKLGYPMFVKPANAGSSIGIGKAKNKDELIDAINEAFKFDYKILVEEFIEGHEVECAVLGYDDNVISSYVGEVLACDEFYTYDAKYSSQSTSQTLIPANISDKHSQIIRKNAIKAFKALDGCGLSRVDFFVNEDKDMVYINEINTMPGFTSISMYPKLFEKTGIKYKELLTKLINIGLK